MTVCEFRHEAGRAHDRLAARLETAMEGLPELVQDVTGLPLPTDPPPVVRLVTLRQWRRALQTHHDHLLRREVRRTRMTLLQVLRAARWQKKVRRYRLSRWIQVAAQTVGDRDGRPQVLAIADALHHTGTTDAGLIKLLGHELTHVAQHQAGGGFALDAANLRLLVVRHRPDGAVQDYWGLTEGHAMWSEEEITQRRLGRAVPFGDGEDTEVGRRERERYADGVYQGWMDSYVQAGDWARHVIEERGLEAFNRTWSLPILCPTEGEIRAPDSYLAYLDRHVTRSDARPDIGALVKRALLADGQPPITQP